MLNEFIEKYLTPTLCLIIFLLLIIIYYEYNKIQDFKHSVLVSWNRGAKHALNAHRGASAVFPTVIKDQDPEPLVLSSLNAEILKPCGKINFNHDKYDPNKTSQKYKKGNDCKLSIINAESEVIKLFNSLGPISFTVNDGKKDFNVTGHKIILFGSEGSYCSTTYLGGRQYEDCISQQELCNEYRTYDFPPSFWTLAEFLVEFHECNGYITN